MRDLGPGRIPRFLTLATGVRVPYVEQGNIDGIPLIFLHGYMDSWRALEPVLDNMPSAIHAFAYSQRGQGESSAPEGGYRPSDFAADLAALMDALEIRAAVIVGASSGGLAALSFTLGHPQRTLGLVLAGSPVTLRGHEAIEQFLVVVRGLADPVDISFIRDFQISTLAQTVPSSFIDTVVAESAKAPAWVWEAVLKPLLEADFIDRLREVQVPTLVVWGDRDHMLTRAEEEATASAIPEASLLIYEGAGHAFYWEEPKRFAMDLTEFCQTVSARQASTKDSEPGKEA